MHPLECRVADYVCDRIVLSGHIVQLSIMDDELLIFNKYLSGVVNVKQCEIEAFLIIGQRLKIKGFSTNSTSPPAPIFPEESFNENAALLGGDTKANTILNTKNKCITNAASNNSKENAVENYNIEDNNNDGASATVRQVTYRQHRFCRMPQTPHGVVQNSENGAKHVGYGITTSSANHSRGEMIVFVHLHKFLDDDHVSVHNEDTPHHDQCHTLKSVTISLTKADGSFVGH
uniref:Uncharacterized protein n=1 Tax=Glossina pallidipes TaxID=7398 RepID=A0A1A9ZQ78_GLOPL